ncbi:MAG: FHA domain-containing protein [Deltaproteobacteria bacterium]|nr:FHA domain-containing protein [Deltaproteobacteria bacterium]
MTSQKEETLQDYKKFQVQLSKSDFVKRFNHPFLIFNKEQGNGQTIKHGFNTKRIDPDQLENFIKKTLLRTVSSKILKLVKKGTDSFSGNINIGRASNCDLVINSTEISKFHAFVSKDIKSGFYYITDADSTNGTYVNDVKLTPNEKKILYDGDIISFGKQVNISFYTPEGCYNLLEQISI